MTVYLIDGYNVLHELLRTEGRGAQAKLHAGALEDERGRFLDRVASFMGGSRDRAIAVFDSKKSSLQRAESASRNVQVYFGSFARSADSIIEKCAYDLRQEEDIVVVSSDYVIQQTVFMPTVTRVSARQFILQLKDNAAVIAGRRKASADMLRVEDRIDPEVRAQLEALRTDLAADASSAADVRSND